MKINKKQIEKKHESERIFHENIAKKMDPKKLNFRVFFESPTVPEAIYALNNLGKLKNKRILDLGCGSGEASTYFAKKGARVDAMDISPRMVKITNSLARIWKVGRRVSAKVMLAENLKYPKNTFDLVFGRGVLHHVVLDKALLEVGRVLKPGGVATFIEPLMHNPIINLYRQIAKDVRSPDETPLNYDQIPNISKLSFEVKHKEFQLTTLSIFVWYFLVDRVSPNEERYWDKLMNDAKGKGKLFKFLQKVDEIIFFIFPFLRRFAWYTVLVLTKN